MRDKSEQKYGWNPQAWRGRPERLGDMWTLRKGDRVVICSMFTHPLGGEARCDVDNELFATHASRRLEDLLDASDKWKTGFESKGWT